MHQKRDLTLFLGSVLLWSVALSAIAWSMPRTRGFNPHDALIVIPVAAVILSARGASWRRRLLYAGLVLGVFVAVDIAFLSSGLMGYAFAGLSTGDPKASVMAVTYLFFAQGFPFVVLLIFAGRNPSVLWKK